MFKVTYTKDAYKTLEKIDRPQQKLLISWIEKNLLKTTDPRMLGKPLRGNLSNYWCYRIGTYRLIADIKDNEVTIVILNIGHRKDIYR